VFFRIEGDKVAEFWGVFDRMDMLQQIGAGPATAQPS
jgi:predicted ester cyclase